MTKLEGLFMNRKLTAVIIVLVLLLTAEVIFIALSGPGQNEAEDAVRGQKSIEDASVPDTAISETDFGEGNDRTAPGTGKNDDDTSGAETDDTDGTGADSAAGGLISSGPISLINEEGMTAAERISPPEGFERIILEEGSFGEYLRDLPLKPHGSPVKYYDGTTKPWDVHAAVVDMDVGSRDLQQCADAVIRLRAEYLYKNGRYDQIHFDFTNGFNAKYSKWIQGYRISVKGNEAVWVENGSKGTDYGSFRKYLDMVFSYAGTLSLSREMKRISPEEMQPGDVFLKGGSPGHCVIITDMARNPQTGERVFLIAQSYMPAQDIHILKNPAKDEGNPWYPDLFGEELVTPEWTFSKDQIYRFAD
jgi:hypothetical protein